MLTSEYATIFIYFMSLCSFSRYMIVNTYLVDVGNASEVVVVGVAAVGVAPVAAADAPVSGFCSGSWLNLRSPSCRSLPEGRARAPTRDASPA